MLNKKISTTPQHHAVFLQKQAHDRETKLPVLYLQADGQVRPVTTLIEYFNAHPLKSDSWRKNTARSLGLFWDYCVATSGDKSIWESQNPHRAAFRSFAHALLVGTLSIDDDSDSTGLYWPPTSQRATRNLVSALQQFIDWCVNQNLALPSATPKNGRPSSPEESIVFLAAAVRQARKEKERSLLGHLKSTKEVAQKIVEKERRKIVDLGREIAPPSGDQEAIDFPQHLIEPLLSRGFLLNRDPSLPIFEQEDVTAKMITLLMLFGGTRISEPFHLWFNDVIPDPNQGCKVVLRHPSEAATYLSGEGQKTRATYLRERGLRPRNTNGVGKSYRAGWKNLAVDKSLSAPVYFIHESAEYQFRAMYLYYLRYRSYLMKQRRAEGKPDHPFLFVSHGNGFVGEPYSISAYNGALERAYGRLEKNLHISIPIGKEYGTTPHGFRHRFGRMLEEAGMNVKLIQKAMRHRSPLSQQVYTTPTAERIESELEKARNILSGSYSIGKND
ncbi:MAG: gamma-mobile-trio recombinase GmtY [Marinobacter sp.]|nr:gamma-mobile-trio recombinase GmtY [Marinobacter sp.]